jgi:hypothetical protein
MPSMTTTYTFTNGNVIDSLQMNTNFNDVKAAFNTNAVQVDGTVKATTASLNDGIVTSAKLADLNVTTGKLADLGVTTAKIADLNVTTGKIADLAVTAAKIADSAITSAKIADGTIVNADIASGAAIALSKLGSGTAAIDISGTAAAATNATNATTAANLTGFARGTVVTNFTTFFSGGKNRSLVSFAHGLGGQPSGAAVYNGDHAAMSGLFHVYSVDSTNITVEASDYNNTFVTITGRIYWMAYR